MEKGWHSLEIAEIFHKLETSQTGLRRSDATHRLHKSGPNTLVREKEFSKLRLFVSQFNSLIVWIMIIAAIVSLFIDILDAVVITIIIVINAVIGYFQEYKAERSLEALKRMSALKALVIRHGKEIRIDAADVVKGDIILLEAGNKVPADARLIEVARLEVDESSLTGESTLVAKDEKTLKDSTFLAERVNMVYAGTIISKGTAKAVVVETGMGTELGRIAGMVQQADSEETPLQKDLHVFGEYIGIGVVAVCAIVFMVGLIKGSSNMLDNLMTAVALAVAAIPEGLPAIVTICLAFGVQRMVKKHALIRKLPSVETLGETDIICTDKTGTLTYNQMTVREIYSNSKSYGVTGQGYRPIGEFSCQGRKCDPKEIELLLRCSALCNDSALERTHDDWSIFGDPTEGALVVAAAKAGLDKSKLENDYRRIDTLPFDSARKMMTTIHKVDKKSVAYVKGAPDVLLDRCSGIIINGRIRKLSENDRKSIMEQNNLMADKALRVLGFAYKDITGKKKTDEKSIESDLIFIGLAGMNDPPRKEVRDSIRRCIEAGIRIIMITGDHKATAAAVARELGLGTNVMTGEEISKTEDLKKAVETVDIYARVSPEHKLAIVDALRANGHVVAMTGDGVNDAPALKKADIGVAMGITGTDVSKEASDMVLTDDNFTSIVNAVEEGRTIYDNIKKFLRYLITSNSGEVLTVFAAMMIGYRSLTTGEFILPVLAIQLLWINILTDGFNALALSLEKGDSDIMKRAPRKKSRQIITVSFMIDVAITATIMCAGTLYLFKGSLAESDQLAQTMAFTSLVFFQFFNLFNCRSENESIFSRRLFTNKWLWVAVASSVLLQILVLYTPASHMFKTVALSASDWMMILGAAAILVAVMESKKLIVRVYSTTCERRVPKSI